MKTPLRILIVEDDENDALLLLRELGRGGYEVTFERVQTRETMRDALVRGTWDAVISDYSMPTFDAPSAFALLREQRLDLPFVIVSGTVGEETAVAAMKLGVHDYLLKGKLTRLVPAIERELREARARAERREAERALRASETRFHRLAESGVIGITVTDEAGRIVEANDAFLHVVGRRREELLGSPVGLHELMPSDQRARCQAGLEQARARGAAPPWETEYMRRGGARTSVLVAIASLDGPRCIVVSLDLSERKRLEVELRQAQKMEAIGSLAGGVAHDFNNLLTVILTCASLVLERMGPADPQRDFLLELQKASESAADLTRQLLAFSRKQILQPRNVGLGDIVSAMERMLRRLLGEDVTLSLALHGAGKAFVDPGQVEQIVLNLAVNARDAMPLGGTLSIETATEEVGAAQAASVVGMAPGEYVVLTVSDTGTGMDRETLGRIFEPFFTTKERGKGTGLGLSTVFGIIKQSGGHIAVSSELGTGSTFRIYFPRTEAQDAPTATTTLAPATPRGTETILLVEDDEQVRASLRTILRRQGYNVLEAQNAGEAFLICEQQGVAIQLLITDVVMPRMSGPQLAARLVPLRPELRVLYVSGYADNLPARPNDLAPAFAFLQKPITPDALTRKVREVLDSGRA